MIKTSEVPSIPRPWRRVCTALLLFLFIVVIAIPFNDVAFIENWKLEAIGIHYPLSLLAKLGLALAALLLGFSILRPRYAKFFGLTAMFIGLAPFVVLMILTYILG